MPVSLVPRDYLLFCVRPTGGSTQWTATVCECLSYYLTGAQVKIIIQVCIKISGIYKILSGCLVIQGFFLNILPFKKS